MLKTPYGLGGMLRDRPQIDPVPAVITEPANLPGLSQLPAATQLLSSEAAFYSVSFYTPSEQRVLNLINVYVKYNFMLYYIPWCLYPQSREACRMNRINNPILF